MNYLDNSYLVGDTFKEFEECKDAVIDTCDLLIKLAFSIHPDKSKFIPVQKIEYLGFTLDSTSLTVFDRYKTAKDKNTKLVKPFKAKKLKIR